MTNYTKRQTTQLLSTNILYKNIICRILSLKKYSNHLHYYNPSNNLNLLYGVTAFIIHKCDHND